MSHQIKNNNNKKNVLRNHNRRRVGNLILLGKRVDGKSLSLVIAK